MKNVAALKILAILSLSASTIFILPYGINSPAVLGQTPVTLQVVSPGYGSNITSLALTPGSTFKVQVNVTGAGRLTAFDVTLLYNMTIGPNVIQAVHPQDPDPLTGSLFDPNNPPSGCTITVPRTNLDLPAGQIRYAAFVQGGCTVPGTGTLFSITFQVTGVGATSIDVAQIASSIVGAVGNPIQSTPSLPYDLVNAYFRNKQGIPPIPKFTFTPTTPVTGDAVLFNATQTYDPDNRLAPNKGMQTEAIVNDTNGNKQYDAGEVVIIGPTPALGTSLGAPPPGPFVTNCCRPDPHIVFLLSGTNTTWVNGETVVYDANLNLKFDTGDFVIRGVSPGAGATLTSDPNLTYVDSHRNNIWDNGYVWDFGDPTGLFTGNVTSHVFISSPTVSSAGRFQVRLVVFDSDDSLPNRQTEVVKVDLFPTRDVSVFLELSKPTLNVGETVGISVRISNRGNKIIDRPHNMTASMNTTYDFNTITAIGSESGISLSVGEFRLFSYSIATSSLTPRTYTVTVRAAIINATTGEVIPNAAPDNVASQSFVLQGSTAPSLLSLPILAGATVAVVAVVSAVVYVLRRRRTEEA